MNLEIRFRTLTVITIKGICALFQQEKNDRGKQSEMNNKPHIVAVRVLFSAKKLVNQQQHVPVPQVEIKEPAISVRAAIIANFQLLKIDFLEWFCLGDGFRHCEVLSVTGNMLVTEKMLRPPSCPM